MGALSGRGEQNYASGARLKLASQNRVAPRMFGTAAACADKDLAAVHLLFAHDYSFGGVEHRTSP